VRIDEAAALIAAAVTAGGQWAELGAGRGTFTRGLASLLGESGSVVAVDTDARALRELEGEARIETVIGDFHRLDLVDGFRDRRFDGVLFANSLHFSGEAERVIADAAGRLRTGGVLVVVEYDRRPASRWVPYPLGVARLGEIAERVGLSAPRVIGERRSDYGGVMYAAVIGTSVKGRSNVPESRFG
jgi:SAM-dependent methyltransferase